MTRRQLVWAGMLGALALAFAAVSVAYKQSRREAALERRLGQTVPVGPHSEVPCPLKTGPRPLILLALGQSNAGNHGAPGAQTMDLVTMIAGDKCISAHDPLPGATGTGASIWPRVAAQVSRDQTGRQVLISLLALESSSIDEWTRSGSALRQRLASQLASMKRLGLPPDYILWQQGEADARDGTSANQYATKLDQLADILSQAGANAPILLAQSTVCRTLPNTEIRTAMTRRVAQGGRWRKGPDTDTLIGPQFRRDDCHLSAAGLDAAAKMWAAGLAAAENLPKP